MDDSSPEVVAKRQKVERRRAVSNESVANKVLLLEGVHTNAAEILRKNGFHVETETASLSEDELVNRLEGVVALGVRSKTKVTPRVLAAAKSLLCTGNFCIGTDSVDLQMAEEMGVASFNAPFSNTRSVAELIMSHCIALARRVFDVSSKMHAGTWQKSAKGCNEVRGKTIGIIGYGHVGTQVSVLAESLGMHVLFFDTISKMPIGNAVAASSIEALLPKCEFITLHVPRSAGTTNMITSKELALMKPGAYMINYSRGTVVDIDALAASLRSGHLAGAAIDVFPSEPRGNGPGFESALMGCPNTILTPHIGGSTQEAQALIGTEVAHKLVNYILHGDTSTAVNVPQLPPLSKATSSAAVLLNVHRNVPGVLGNINKILASVNVRGQQLRTTNRVGYIHVELDADVSDEVMMSIQALDTSIRTRILHT